MRELLAKKLYSYIVENNPELLLPLAEGSAVSDLINAKLNAIEPLMDALLEKGEVPYAIAEICMEEMVADLKPSRFHYVKDVLEEEFSRDYERFVERGLLTFVIANIIRVAGDVWERYEFSDSTVDDRFLRYEVIAFIAGEVNGM